jgi:hypothetical protein
VGVKFLVTGDYFFEFGVGNRRSTRTMIVLVILSPITLANALFAMTTRDSGSFNGSFRGRG